MCRYTKCVFMAEIKEENLNIPIRNRIRRQDLRIPFYCCDTVETTVTAGVAVVVFSAEV